MEEVPGVVSCDPMNAANASNGDSGASAGGSGSGVLAEAIWNHASIQQEELPFAVGDVIEIWESSENGQLMYGSLNERFGWFPSSYVRMLTNHEILLSGAGDDRLRSIDSVEDLQHALLASTAASITSSSTVGQSPSTHRARMKTRANVVREIITTERDYVRLLENLVDGFLKQAERRPDMFTAERLLLIFGNLEQICGVNRKFLVELEQCVNGANLAASEIGDCFLRHRRAFEVYSDYCNNHPLSSAELASLYQHARYRHFFEACRLLRGDMPEISLDGFLLTPVQRICKYPLQLGELVKCTPPEHPDYRSAQRALDAMRRVASVINDRKRRLESLQKLAVWQRSIEAWACGDLLETSSVLVGCGQVSCRKWTSTSIMATTAASVPTQQQSVWLKDVTLFVFDRLMVLCKKDILKRSQLIYKDRIFIDRSSIVDVPEGVQVSTAAVPMDSPGVDLLHSPSSCSSAAATMTHYLFVIKSRKQKAQWLHVLREERRLANDLRQNPIPSSEERRIAIASIKCNLSVPAHGSPRRPKTSSKRLPDLLLVSAPESTASEHGSRRLTRKWSASAFMKMKV